MEQSGASNAEILDLLFQEFQVHFRSLEAWHAKQRVERYEMLHEKSTRQLRKELKGQKADGVQHLHFDETFEVVDAEHDLIWLHKPAEVFATVAGCTKKS